MAGRQQEPRSHINVDALDTKVDILDNEIKEVNSRITDFNEKFDRVITSFASEFRASIANLSTQFSERNKTPWGVLISGIGVTLTIVTLIGHQALAPISDTLSIIQRDLVPRKEVEFRHETVERRLTLVESDLKTLHQREYDRLQQQLDVLQRENNLLKYPPKT